MPKVVSTHMQCFVLKYSILPTFTGIYVPDPVLSYLLASIAETSKCDLDMHLGHIQFTCSPIFLKFINIFLLLAILIVFCSQDSVFYIMVMKYMSLCASSQRTCTTGGTLANGLENYQEKRK